MKPRLKALDLTFEDCAVWAAITHRSRCRNFIQEVRASEFYAEADRRDDLIMHGREKARHGIGPGAHMRPAQYWVAPDGSVDFIQGWARPFPQRAT